MSYDRFIYSQQSNPVNRKALVSAMRARGWEVRFLPDNAFIGAQPLQLLSDDGALEDCLVAGWPVRQENSKLLDAMFAAGNAVGLTELFKEEDAFATCGLDITQPFVYNSDDLALDSEKELRDAVGDEVVDYQKNAKVFYYLRLSGMSIVTAGAFADDLWKSIATLSEGLLDDPQVGAYYLISPKGRVVRVDTLPRRLMRNIRRIIGR